MNDENLNFEFPETPEIPKLEIPENSETETSKTSESSLGDKILAGTLGAALLFNNSKPVINKVSNVFKAKNPSSENSKSEKLEKSKTPEKPDNFLGIASSIEAIAKNLKPDDNKNPTISNALVSISSSIKEYVKKRFDNQDTSIKHISNNKSQNVTYLVSQQSQDENKENSFLDLLKKLGLGFLLNGMFGKIIKGLIGNTAKFLLAALGATIAGLSKTIKSIISNIPKIYEFIKTTVKGAIELVGKSIRGITEFVKGIEISKGFETIKNLDVIKNSKFISSAKNTLQTLKTSVTDSKVVKLLIECIEAMKNWNLMGRLIPIFENAVNIIRTAGTTLGKSIESLIQVLSPLINAIKQMNAKLVSSLISKFSKVCKVSGILVPISLAIDGVIGAIFPEDYGLETRTAGAAAGVVDGILSFGDMAIGGIATLGSIGTDLISGNEINWTEKKNQFLETKFASDTFKHGLKSYNDKLEPDDDTFFEKLSDNFSNMIYGDKEERQNKRKLEKGLKTIENYMNYINRFRNEQMIDLNSKLLLNNFDKFKTNDLNKSMLNVINTYNVTIDELDQFRSFLKVRKEMIDLRSQTTGAPKIQISDDQYLKEFLSIVLKNRNLDDKKQISTYEGSLLSNISKYQTYAKRHRTILVMNGSEIQEILTIEQLESLNVVNLEMFADFKFKNFFIYRSNDNFDSIVEKKIKEILEIWKHQYNSLIFDFQNFKEIEIKKDYETPTNTKNSAPEILNSSNSLNSSSTSNAQNVQDAQNVQEKISEYSTKNSSTSSVPSTSNVSNTSSTSNNSVTEAPENLNTTISSSVSTNKSDDDIVEMFSKSNSYSYLNKDNIAEAKSDKTIYNNILTTYKTIFKPIKEKFPDAKFSSGFRGSELNSKVGGKSNSKHKTGQAVDITFSKHTVEEVQDAIKKGEIPGLNKNVYGLNEYGRWLHASVGGPKGITGTAKISKGGGYSYFGENKKSQSEQKDLETPTVKVENSEITKNSLPKVSQLPSTEQKIIINNQNSGVSVQNSEKPESNDDLRSLFSLYNV